MQNTKSHKKYNFRELGNHVPCMTEARSAKQIMNYQAKADKNSPLFPSFSHFDVLYDPNDAIWK